MGPNAILALKMITDLIMILGETVNTIMNMKDEEVDAKILMEEALSKALKKRRQEH